MKYELKYIPIMGWGWWANEYIFIKRVWETDSKVLTREINEICNYPKELFYNVTESIKLLKKKKNF
jgi:1-acyl-sn-glycerol-3-phosphate acyltransferase